MTDLTYTQPVLELPTAAPKWADAIAALEKHGIYLKRQTDLGTMRAGEAEWFAATTLPEGDRIRVQAIRYRGLTGLRWMLHASRDRYLGEGERGPIMEEASRIQLRNPCAVEAMAALIVLGLDGAS